MSKKPISTCPVRKTSIGGQALMEGIMMRGPKTTAMAVRNPQGEIILETFPTVGKPRPAICRWPLIRGIVGFVDSMTLGYKCLMRSAEIAGLEELEAEMEKEKAAKKAEKKAKRNAKRGMIAPEEAPVDDTPADETPAEETPTEIPADGVEATDGEDAVEEAVPILNKHEKKESSVMMTVIMVISVVIAFAIAIGLFVILPTFLYDKVLERFIPWFADNAKWMQSVFEGVLRVLLLLGYMSLMLLMKDIRRTFQFHGAEHKTIFCYEKGLELTVENIRRQRRFHPRCGTSFLILMVLVSVVIGMFIPTAIRALCKLAVFPLIMGIGYELIKLCGRHDTFLTRIISAPGLWFQRITVLEPDDAMIECAIVAMKEAIPDDGSDSM